MKKNTFEYKGYIGTIEWSEEDGIFCGELIGIKGMFMYEGKDINALRKDFKITVDEYLNYCKERKLKPQIPYKGSFNVRVTSDLHRQVSEKAMAQGISLNKFVQLALENAVKI